MSAQGFPAISVPAGFTTAVYDRVADPTPPPPPAPTDGVLGGGAGGPPRIGTRLVSPIPAKLPVGLDILGRPFTEPLLIRIASACEAATKHRTPPPDFGPLASEK